MAIYVYKAMTRTGMIVRNKVEAPTKQLLINMLKNSDLLPISIDRAPNLQRKQAKRQKKNIDNKEYMKSFNSTDIEENHAMTTRDKNVLNANSKNYK